MKEKKLLIVERCNSNLSVINESIEGGNQEIILSGIFTTFNQMNRNGRIYESADFLPHVDALKEQIDSKRLMGELDHPHGFEISLANVSHIIESLEYDEQQNAIIGKIRLLNTPKGQIAQALVKDGVQLNISSRAAGTVDESGHVRLQQLFTYDLVADPGFANAQLKRVNESYGFGDDSSIDIYDISEGANTDLIPPTAQEGGKPAGMSQADANAQVAAAASKGTIDDTTQNNDMDNGQYIQYSDFQKYSEHLTEIISELQSAIANYKTELAAVKAENNPAAPSEKFDAAKVDNTAIADLVAKGVAEKTAEIEEQYNQLKAYCNYLGEQLDNSISHQDYIANEANKMIKHQDYLAESMNKMIKHQDYIVENLNDTIGYQNYISEMLDKSIDYSNMLAEEANKTNSHQDYLVEQMNKMVDHQDYLAENMNKMIGHQDYLAENMNSMISYQDYLAENLDKSIQYANYIAENVNTGSENKLNETVVEQKPAEPVVEAQTTAQPVVEQKPTFDAQKYQTELSEKLDTLLSTVKTQYAEAKQKEAEAIEESRTRIQTADFNLINYMPARLNERWSKLSDERKQEILAEAKMFVISNPASAEYFWNTRDMRDKQIKVVEEQVVAQPTAQPVNESVMTDERYKMMAEMLKHRMRKF